MEEHANYDDGAKRAVIGGGPVSLGAHKGQELKPTEAEKVIKSLIEVVKMLEEISSKYHQRLQQYSNPLPTLDVIEDKSPGVIPDYFFELSGQFERIKYQIDTLNQIYNAMEL